MGYVPRSDATRLERQGHSQIQMQNPDSESESATKLAAIAAAAAAKYESVHDERAVAATTTNY